MRLSGVLLAALAGGVGGGWSGVPAFSLDSLAHLTSGHVGPGASRYELGAVEAAEVVKTVTATGSVNSTINVEVGSQLSGQVVTRAVDFNDTVHKGQILAQLDDRAFARRSRLLAQNSKAQRLTFGSPKRS